MRIPILLGFLLCFGIVRAQVTSQTSTSDGSIRTHIQGIDIPSIANAPFTAKIVVTWNQPLVGGGTLSRKYYTMVARDAQGRVRREIRDFVSANSSDEPPLRSFTIIDPVAGTRITCTQASMNCTTAIFHPRVTLANAADTRPGTGKVSRQSLGQDIMDSLPVVGTRETATTNSNDRLIVSHTEYWYAPDLQIDLSVVRTNPQLGQVTLTVSDLSRAEPGPSWFLIPSGYEVRTSATK